MNFVPHRYRNVINPWQTEKDIQSAVRFCSIMAYKILGIVQVNPGEEEGVEEYRKVFGLDRPDRDWNNPK